MMGVLDRDILRSVASLYPAMNAVLPQLTGRRGRRYRIESCCTVCLYPVLPYQHR